MQTTELLHKTREITSLYIAHFQIAVVYQGRRKREQDKQKKCNNSDQLFVLVFIIFANANNKACDYTIHIPIFIQKVNGPAAFSAV